MLWIGQYTWTVILLHVGGYSWSVGLCSGQLNLSLWATLCVYLNCQTLCIAVITEGQKSLTDWLFHFKNFNAWKILGFSLFFLIWKQYEFVVIFFFIGVANVNNPITQAKIAEENTISTLVSIFCSTSNDYIKVEIAKTLACVILGNKENQALLKEEPQFEMQLLLNLLHSKKTVGSLKLVLWQHCHWLLFRGM